jgi:hypothetical protein
MRTEIMLKIYTPACLLIFLLACTPPSKDSDQIATKDIYVKARLTGHNDYTRVEVNLYEDRYLGDVLELSDGEYITVSFMGNTIELAQSNDLFEIDYQGNIDNANQGGIYSLTLFRSDGTAITSTVEMAAPFTITSPSAGNVYTEENSVNIEWASEYYEGEIELDTFLMCWNWDDDDGYDSDTETESDRINDSGNFSLPLNEMAENIKFESFLENDVFDYSRPCEFDLSLSRIAIGDLSGVFAEGSTIEAKQFREVSDMFVIMIE